MRLTPVRVLPFGVAALLALSAPAAPPPQFEWSAAEAQRRMKAVASEPRADAAAAATYFARAIGTPNSDYASLLRETGDGGYVLGGVNNLDFQTGNGELDLFKLDGSGALVWKKRYTPDTGGYGAISATPDGGYLVDVSYTDTQTGETPFTVVKTDANGAIQWQKLVGDPASDTFDTSLILKNGDILVTGTGFSLQTFTSTQKWVRLSSTGSVLWQVDFSNADLIGFPEEQADGSFLVAGYKQSFLPGSPPADGFIRKVSSTGSVLWEKTYGGPQYDSLLQVISANGGGFIAVGTSASWSSAADDYDVWVLKLDANGNVLTQKAFGGTGAESGVIIALSDGYMLSGSTKSTGNPSGDTFIAKLDNNLNVVWAKYYHGPGTTNVYGFPDSTGSGFFMSGLYDSASRGRDILAAKLDSTGNIVWQHAIGGGGDDTGFAFRSGSFVTFGSPTGSPAVSATALADPDVIAVGSTTSWGAGSSDAFLARLDGNAQISGCPIVENSTVVATTWAIPSVTTTATVTNGSPSASPGNHQVTNGTVVAVNATLTSVNACSATPAFSASASANKTSGTAPLSVSFTGTAANGTLPYTWEWDFGDGTAKSTQQNPTHDYTIPGIFVVTLKVTDASPATVTDDHLTINVSSACSVTCSATVPATGNTGEVVHFGSSYNSSGCTDPVTYSWTFGDGGTASTDSPTHTYASAGAYDWSLTIARGSSMCSKSGTITIGGGGGTTYTYWVPSIAHLKGTGTSKWRSNIAVVNRSGSTAHLTLVYVPYASGSTVTKTYDLANGATVEWSDILVSFFGFADTASPKGTIKITSDQPVQALARTYNQADTGTFGQYYPSLTAAQGISSSQAAVLPGLKKNASFRTNVAFQNLTGSTCSGEVKLFDANGAQVGTTQTLTAAADKYIQSDDIFAKASAGNQDVAYARVQPTTAGCKLWFFGSVIDAATNDPTTVPQILSVAGPYWIPSIAHLKGSGTSVWRSNIAVVNRSGATANLTLTYVPYASGSNVTKTYALANNHAVEWSDVLVSLFGFATTASPKGTVKITSDRALFAVARTYNQAATGTFGQYYPALVQANAITSGQAVLPLMKKSSSFRSNAAFQNLGGASCTGTIKLYNAAGVQVGSTRTLTAALDKYIQDDDVFAKASAGNQEPAYALVQVTTPGGMAWFSGSVIDANTNDPTTVPQQF